MKYKVEIPGFVTLEFHSEIGARDFLNAYNSTLRTFKSSYHESGGFPEPQVTSEDDMTTRGAWFVGKVFRFVTINKLDLKKFFEAYATPLGWGGIISKQSYLF
jgi:hypothetical protein